MYQEARHVSSVQRWRQVKEKKVRMRSKMHPLGLAKKEVTGDGLGTESEARGGDRRWPRGEAREKWRPHSNFSHGGGEGKGVWRDSSRWKE